MIFIHCICHLVHRSITCAVVKLIKCLSCMQEVGFRTQLRQTLVAKIGKATIKLSIICMNITDLQDNPQTYVPYKWMWHAKKPSLLNGHMSNVDKML